MSIQGLSLAVFMKTLHGAEQHYLRTRDASYISSARTHVVGEPEGAQIQTRVHDPMHSTSDKYVGSERHENCARGNITSLVRNDGLWQPCYS